MDTCAACHEKEVKNFKLTQHARIQIPGEGPRVEGEGCESCHGPGSLHVDSGGDRKLIVNPGKSPEACFQCHLDKNAEFSLQFHHPVKEGRMSCTSCHDPHGEDILKPKEMQVGRVNQDCAQCHREQARPHVFEHEAMREGCTSCHNRARLDQLEDVDRAGQQPVLEMPRASRACRTRRGRYSSATSITRRFCSRERALARAATPLFTGRTSTRT